jgi:hypothetical protein
MRFERTQHPGCVYLRKIREILQRRFALGAFSRLHVESIATRKEQAGKPDYDADRVRTPGALH